MTLYTLNGELILQQNVAVESEDLVSSCAFYEGLGNEYLERELVFTGHKRGVVNVSHPVACMQNENDHAENISKLWNKAIRNGKFVLEHVKRMDHLDQGGFNVSAAITSILPMAQVVYTGDDDGRVVRHSRDLRERKTCRLIYNAV